MGGINIHFSQAEFEQRAPKDWENRFGSIYSSACSMCLHATGFWLTEWKCQLRVLYVFEEGNLFQGQADELLFAMGQESHLRDTCRYRKHMFEAKTEPGLQAGDMFSWIVTKTILLNGQVPRSMRGFVAPLMRLLHGSAGRYKLYPFEGERLDRFLASVLSQPEHKLTSRGPHPRGLR